MLSLGADHQNANTKHALQREELPTYPLSASTRKACLDGNELVPGYLSGKVGLVIVRKNNDMKNYIYIVQEIILDSGNKVTKRTLKLQSMSPVKIGLTLDVQDRIATLQTANPRKIKLLSEHGPFSRKEALSIEGQLHARLKNYRIRGEWFHGQCLPLLKILIDSGFMGGKVVSIREAKERRNSEARVDVKLANKEERRFQRELVKKAIRMQ